MTLEETLQRAEVSLTVSVLSAEVSSKNLVEDVLEEDGCVDLLLLRFELLVDTERASSFPLNFLAFIAMSLISFRTGANKSTNCSSSSCNALLSSIGTRFMSSAGDCLNESGISTRKDPSFGTLCRNCYPLAVSLQLLRDFQG